MYYTPVIKFFIFTGVARSNHVDDNLFTRGIPWTNRLIVYVREPTSVVLDHGKSPQRMITYKDQSLNNLSVKRRLNWDLANCLIVHLEFLDCQITAKKLNVK